jgi:transposase
MLMPRKRYTKEFKAQAVDLVRHGKPVQEVAQDLEVGRNLIYKWIQKETQAPQLGSEGLRAEGEESVADERGRLRRQNARLQLENDILKKAAVILGTKTPNNNAT